ncbi:protein transport protein Sec16B-like [Eucyclogobius newberryi]|uniref:protein transport protein Sec16B-like n=1 Tax=Eucyclogobius newberryi TaxID=166745 RepID=UPI003B59E917
MEHRGHPRSQMVNPKARDSRADYYKYPTQDRGQYYPPPDPRKWDRTWGRPESHFRPPVTSPVQGDPYAYGPQHFPQGYGWTEQQRPHSRHGYDHSAYTQWDYRDSYGYYQHDHYGGQHQHADAGQWGQHDSWQREQYQDNTKQKNTSTSTEYHQRKDSTQTHKDDYEDAANKENGETSSSYYLGSLENSRISGLSSSSYELSLYINGAEQSEPAPLPAPSQTEPSHQLSAPLKYSIPHAVVSFGPSGQLLRVCPGFTTQKNVSHLEIHSMEVILSETKEQQETRKFPGPLTRYYLHKVDAIEFAHQMAGACLRDVKLHDKSSAALLWNLLILFCRQNGQIVGSDMAELLVQGSRRTGGGQSDSASLIDFIEGSVAEAPPSDVEDDLLTGHCSSESAHKALRSYTQLLLAGRKKEALESAMNSGLWGYALFLASKMDSRSYTTVLNRFTGQLTANDPLQTLFQLLSGRIPAVATCCGSEKWGDWRPHLAVILSNETSDPAVKQKAVSTMGDTLASRGLLHSAHVCYLTAGLPFGAFTQKDERLVFLGSSHRRPFKDFATNSAIQCTELLEYCQNLGGKYFSIPSFQVYKFLYATRLLDCGLPSQVFYYCEVVGQAILRQNAPMFVLTDLLLKVQCDGIASLVNI